MNEWVVVLGLMTAVVAAAIAGWFGLQRHEAEQLAAGTLEPRPRSGETASLRFDWERLGGELGLEFVESGGAAGRLLLGAREGMGLSVAEMVLGPSLDRQASGVALEVDGRGLIPSGVSLRLEGGLDGLKKLVAGQDVLLGDPVFDARANVQGPEDAVLATLREPARRALLPLLGRHPVTLKDGVLRLELTGLVEHEPLKQAALDLVEVARTLCAPSVPEALADAARAEPDPELRLRSLQALLSSWRDHPAARRAGEAAAADGDARARLLAARLLAGDRGTALLRALVDEAAVADPVRLGALETLLEVRPALLGEALRGWAQDAVLAEASARGLGALGEGSAEPLLLGLLAGPDPRAAAAAVEALGLVGSIRAVEPLSALAARGALQAAARDAMRRIQSRLGDAEAGRVSVVEDLGTTGALSLPDARVAGSERVEE